MKEEKERRRREERRRNMRRGAKNRGVERSLLINPIESNQIR